ncbi:MAG TPA: PepSY-associated TM helix domain-containing protein, partial [Candidatus Kapabacteria bacterium]|nr:PepSY-associated TM helix domain-containing protein [Candidatus Kapabacteria bacterium]
DDTPVDRALVDNILAQTGETGKYKSHFRASPGHLQIFLESGVMDVNLNTGQVEFENKRNRPVLREFNFLHLNHAGKIWTWAADIYAVGLFLLAVTGLFILKGKNGLKGRGKWFVIAGILVPLVFLFLYFY